MYNFIINNLLVTREEFFKALYDLPEKYLKSFLKELYTDGLATINYPLGFNKFEVKAA